MENENDSIVLFDTLFTTNHLQILKALVPYLEPPMQKQMAIYIKYSEFQYTLSYYKDRHAQIAGCSAFERKNFDFPEFYNCIKGYCTEDERQKLEQIANMMNAMAGYKEMMSMMEMMQQMSSETGDSDPMDMIKNMLSPEQQAMFDMFQNMEESES